MGQSGHTAWINRGPQVLHQHGIDPGGDGLARGKLQCSQFVVEDERVERDVALDAAAVQVAHQRGEFVGGEVDGPGAGVQPAAEAEIDGIRAVFHGGRRRKRRRRPGPAVPGVAACLPA